MNLIQKNIQPAQLDGLAERDTRDLRDKRDTKNFICPRRARLACLALHAPRRAVDSPAPLG